MKTHQTVFKPGNVSSFGTVKIILKKGSINYIITWPRLYLYKINMQGLVNTIISYIIVNIRIIRVVVSMLHNMGQQFPINNFLLFLFLLLLLFHAIHNLRLAQEMLISLVLWSQQFKTYMKVKSYTGAVVIRLHCKHAMFTYISVSHKHTAKHCIISQFHTNIKATAPY